MRAFRNVCRHRGSELLTGSGRCKRAIRCRYHGWTYDSTDGRLIGVPEHRNYAELDKATLGLIPARVEELAGLVFVNLDPDATPLAETTAGLAERLERYRIGPGSLRRQGGDGTQPANWKIVVENYLEGYHVPIAHPGLMRLLDYKRYDDRPARGLRLVRGPAARRARPATGWSALYQRLARPMAGLDDADRHVWRYVFIYPNTAIDLYPDQVNIWKILAEGDAPSPAIAGAASGRPTPGPVTRLVQRINQRLNNEVLDEDIDLVSAVQTGIRTPRLLARAALCPRGRRRLVRRPHPARPRRARPSG